MSFAEPRSLRGLLQQQPNNRELPETDPAAPKRGGASLGNTRLAHTKAQVRFLASPTHGASKARRRRNRLCFRPEGPRLGQSGVGPRHPLAKGLMAGARGGSQGPPPQAKSRPALRIGTLEPELLAACQGVAEVLCCFPPQATALCSRAPQASHPQPPPHGGEPCSLCSATLLHPPGPLLQQSLSRG